MLEKHISFLILSSAAALNIPPLFFNHCPFKAPPPDYTVSSDWSAQTRLSQHH